MQGNSPAPRARARRSNDRATFPDCSCAGVEGGSARFAGSRRKREPPRLSRGGPRTQRLRVHYFCPTKGSVAIGGVLPPATKGGAFESAIGWRGLEAFSSALYVVPSYVPESHAGASMVFESTHWPFSFKSRFETPTNQ